MDHVSSRTDPRISVNRIAERATINRVTFYLHYRDIPDMLEKMADDMILEIKKVQKDIAIGYGSSALIGTIVSWLRN